MHIVAEARVRRRDLGGDLRDRGRRGRRFRGKSSYREMKEQLSEEAVRLRARFSNSYYLLKSGRF